MKVRVTGVIVEGDKILLLDQDVEDSRSWSLPGGTLEEGETLNDALIREMKEETGLDTELEKLLYICDHITEKGHIVHVTFKVRVAGGELGKVTEGLDTNKIRGVQFAEIAKLTELGFSKKFQDIVENDFPGSGSYMGPKSAIGL